MLHIYDSHMRSVLVWPDKRNKNILTNSSCAVATSTGQNCFGHLWHHKWLIGIKKQWWNITFNNQFFSGHPTRAKLHSLYYIISLFLYLSGFLFFQNIRIPPSDQKHCMQSITDLVGLDEAFNCSSADLQLNADHSFASVKNFRFHVVILCLNEHFCSILFVATYHLDLLCSFLRLLFKGWMTLFQFIRSMLSELQAPASGV